MENALLEAKRLRMDCAQVFTKNQQQWQSTPLSREQIEAWFAAMNQTGITDVVSHDSYLINMASPAKPLREKSIALMRVELERCEALAIPYLVAHPGAHVGSGVAAGCKRVAGALNRLHRSLKGFKTITLLETTAGQGTTLGRTFEEIARILDQVHAPERVAVCIDTAHMFAAGYDLTSSAGAGATLQELDDVLGLGRVKVVHVNDSKAPFASLKDRHAHIGHGHIDRKALARIVTDDHLLTVPKILETAKGKNAKGRSWDQVNLTRLRRMRRPQQR